MDKNSSVNTILLVIVIILLVGGIVWWFAERNAVNRNTPPGTNSGLNVDINTGGRTNPPPPAPNYTP